MLEFREDFFEQEIRNGFYIDTTMKTVWASELELLQLVAEVCDRHGLTWYACYGTLLGAIRHEGFVPWDDDMDIVMKRKDYMKLLEVLPKELPEGYSVRSPQTDVGYEQYHTCINNGSGICITQEWLVRNHGCPFTIGLDIFPLDYVPRNEEERNLQRTLVTLAGRLAQMAGVLSADKGLPESEGEKTEEEYLEDLKEGISFLEETCKIRFDYSMIDEERWDDARSALWKLANELAMMYDESESDYLAMYIDYVQWEHKKFPKQWFDEVWSASFEGFMLPIPCGYHEVLSNSYGDYMMYRRKTGLHEYPYYARQLRQLREYVKDVEERAEKAGIVSVDEIEVQAEPLEIPKEWIPLVTKQDGTRKKIVLSANDPVVYMTYGDEALDKLENTLKQMEEVQADVALWWRPQPVMTKLLGRVSAQLAERYQAILENYKAAGWGICDESDNTDRAVEQCDVYYGEMNAILQPFQNVGKAVVIAHMGDVDYKESNEARLIEYKAFPNFTDFVEIGEKRYFLNPNYNALMVLDESKSVVKEVIPLEKSEQGIFPLHCKCVERQGRICLLPIGGSVIQVYNTKNGMQKSFELEEVQNVPAASWSSFICGGQVYLLPSHYTQRLWRWKVQEDDFESEDWWQVPIEGSHLRHGVVNEECFYSLHAYSNQLYITNIVQKTITRYILADDDVARIQYDGHNFWYVKKGCRDLVCWNESQGEVCRYQIYPEMYEGEKTVTEYLDICCAGDKVFLVSQDGESIYCLDKENKTLRYLYTIGFTSQNFKTKDKRPYFKQVDDCLIIMLEAIDEVIVIDLNTMSIEQRSEKFCLDEDAKACQNDLLLASGALIFEDEELINLETLLQHCRG